MLECSADGREVPGLNLAATNFTFRQLLLFEFALGQRIQEAN